MGLRVGQPDTFPAHLPGEHLLRWREIELKHRSEQHPGTEEVCLCWEWRGRLDGFHGALFFMRCDDRVLRSRHQRRIAVPALSATVSSKFPCGIQEP